MGAGRPTDYKEEYHNEKAYKLALLGATDVEMADIFEVSEVTFNAWKNKHPEFLKSIKKGKEDADANVANRLYQRAMGYEHTEEKVFNDNGSILVHETTKHYPPDTAAAIFWLKNRQSDKWRDKQDVDHTSKGEKINNIHIEIVHTKNKGD